MLTVNHGLWVSYYQWSVKNKGEYQDGKRSGHWVFRHETGELMFEGGFKEGEEGFGKFSLKRVVVSKRVNTKMEKGGVLDYTKTGKPYRQQDYSQGIKVSD